MDYGARGAHLGLGNHVICMVLLPFFFMFSTCFSSFSLSSQWFSPSNHLRNARFRLRSGSLGVVRVRHRGLRPPGNPEDLRVAQSGLLNGHWCRGGWKDDALEGVGHVFGQEATGSALGELSFGAFPRCLLLLYCCVFSSFFPHVYCVSLFLFTFFFLPFPCFSWFPLVLELRSWF